MNGRIFLDVILKGMGFKDYGIKKLIKCGRSTVTSGPFNGEIAIDSNGNDITSFSAKIDYSIQINRYPQKNLYRFNFENGRFLIEIYFENIKLYQYSFNINDENAKGTMCLQDMEYEINVNDLMLYILDGTYEKLHVSLDDVLKQGLEHNSKRL